MIIICFWFTFILQILPSIVLLLCSPFSVSSEFKFPFNRYIFGKHYFLPNHLMCFTFYFPVLTYTKTTPHSVSYQLRRYSEDIVRRYISWGRPGKGKKGKRWMTSRLWKLKMSEGQMIQRKGEWSTWENKAKVVRLTGNFLMKLKSEGIENGQDNTTRVKVRPAKLQKEIQGLQRVWLEECRSKIFVGGWRISR